MIWLRMGYTLEYLDEVNCVISVVIFYEWREMGAELKVYNLRSL